MIHRWAVTQMIQYQLNAELANGLEMLLLLLLLLLLKIIERHRCADKFV